MFLLKRLIYIWIEIPSVQIEDLREGVFRSARHNWDISQKEYEMEERYGEILIYQT